MPINKQIVKRLTALQEDAREDGEYIHLASLEQFVDFFRHHQDLSVPRITLTPDRTLRARWMHGEGNFLALEFLGKPLIKMIEEHPEEDCARSLTEGV